MAPPEESNNPPGSDAENSSHRQDADLPEAPEGSRPVGSIPKVLADVLRSHHASESGALQKLVSWFKSVFPEGGGPGPKIRPRPLKVDPRNRPPYVGPIVRHPGSGSADAVRAWNRYRATTRADINALKNELKEAVESFKEAAKIYKSDCVQMRSHHENVKKLFEEYSSMLKTGLEVESTSMNISKEHAAELRLLVEELMEAVKTLRTNRGFNMTTIQNFYKGSKVAYDLVCDIAFMGFILGGLLIVAGYLELEEPAPFTPSETKAGRLLNDAFVLGVRVSCTTSIGQSTIMSMLSGELDALESNLLVQHIAEKWQSQIVVSPGRDVVLNGGIEDFLFKGLSVHVNLPLVDGLQRKFELKHKHPFGTVGGVFFLNANPTLSVQAMLGNKRLSAGCEAEYDILPGVVRRVSVGAVINLFGLSLSGMMSKIFPAAGQQQVNVRHELSTSLHLQASDSTSVAAQVLHDIEQHSTSFTVGMHHQFDASMACKLKVTNQGVFTGMVQHVLGGNTSISLCSSVNMVDPEAVVRFGISLSFAP